ncbi:MAG: CHAT domain-containing protein [Chloroflexota bacterium]
MSNLFFVTLRGKAADGWPIEVQVEIAGESVAARYTGLLKIDTATLLQHLGNPLGYGTLLGQALFQDQIRDAFMQASAASQYILPIRLFIEDEPLRTLHWEWLCAPISSGWSMLALEQRFPTAFYLPSKANFKYPALSEGKLQALVMVASPIGLDEYNLAEFDDKGTVSGVETALQPIPTTILATSSTEISQPSLNNLAEHLTATPYNLLHIVCHGQSKRKSGETILYLANDNGEVDTVTATDLIARLQGLSHRPYFVFLSTCETASPQAEQSLGGLGQRLVRELGIPAVVAMTDKVSVQTASELSQKFYERLQEHGQVDLALTEACAGLADHSDITVPALYTRLEAQPLFSQSIESSKKEKTMSDDLEKKENTGTNIQTGGVNVNNNSGTVSIGNITSNVSAGGDVVGGNKIVTTTTTTNAPSGPNPQQVLNEALTEWKKEVETILEALADIDQYEKQDALEAVEKLEAEVKKEAKADPGRLAHLMNTVSKMAPDILEVTAKTLQNPFAGVGLVLEKINGKIELERKENE